MFLQFLYRIDLNEEIIWQRLDKVYENAEVFPVDLRASRWVIVSDLHKGAGDGADDFKDCESAYHAALGYYLEAGYTLVVLGDAEELWEELPGSVLKRYRATFELEAEFFQRGRYWRIWGNHDADWEAPDRVDQYLGGIYKQIRVREGLRLAVQDGNAELGTIFLAHGHQGGLLTDRLGWLSRRLFRIFWRNYQRLTKKKATTPANDWRLRHWHNIAMYNWAASKEEPLIFIAGHTHRPVFRSRDYVSKLSLELQQLRLSGDPIKIAEKRAQLEHARAFEGRLAEEIPGIEHQIPCYFNTGCCSFGDGDITGIELDSGEIRLVRWPDDEANPKPKILDCADLHEVFEKVNGPAPELPFPRIGVT